MRFNIFSATSGGRQFIQCQRISWDQEFTQYIDSMEKFVGGDPVKLLVGGRANET